MNLQEKIETNSEEFQYLVDCHADGTFHDHGYKPADFYRMQSDYNSKYTLKAVQTAWANAKRQAGNKAALVKSSNVRKSLYTPSVSLCLCCVETHHIYPLPFFVSPVAKRNCNTLVSPPPEGACYTSDHVDQGLAKIPKLDESSTFAVAYDNMASHWHPLVHMWTWTKNDGHKMITIEFSPTAGMSPGTTKGIDIYARGATCTITIDWPEELYKQDYVNKYYEEQERDAETIRMLVAKVDSLKSIVKHHGDTPRATVVIPLPFPVIETRNPEMKSVHIEKTGAYIVTIRLASTFVPNHTAKEVQVVKSYAE